MTDPFVDGRLIDCDTCGRPVRLYGHNDVESWTCAHCRNGETPTLLDVNTTVEETATEYLPERARIPYA